MRNKVDWEGGEREYVGRDIDSVKSVLPKKWEASLQFSLEPK